jgi:hypothetical protein
MRKVKNFHINLRTKDIVRSIKRLSPNDEFSDDIEIDIKRACRYYLKFICPSVVYEVFTKDFSDFNYDKDAPSKWVARSVFFTTIGSLLEEEYKNNPSLFSRPGDNLISAIAVDALDQSKNFVCRLIASEAQEEDCDISRPVEIPNEFYDRISQVIPIDKINMSLENGELIPKYSLCAMVYWTPAKKKSKK